METPCSLFRIALLVIAVLVVPFAQGANHYIVKKDFTINPEQFFNSFTFLTETDPTQGFVQYVDSETASSNRLIGYVGSRKHKHIFIGTNFTQVYSSTTTGPQSVRLTSKTVYGPGTLLVADILHMPGGVCGTWPALWMTGPQWPTNGEIDIVEGVNDQSANLMTLHTNAGCSIDNTTTNSSSGQFTGQLTTANCDVNAPGQGQNVGCQIEALSPSTFGSGFNAQGGGVYAMAWTAASIKIWFFPRGAVPASLHTDSIDTVALGQPLAAFTGAGCDFTTHFQRLRLVIDTTFCGVWAGAVWASGGCAAITGAATCEEYVAGSSQAFVDAYWEILSLKMYMAE